MLFFAISLSITFLCFCSMLQTICADIPNSIRFEIRKYAAFSVFPQADHKIIAFMVLWILFYFQFWKSMRIHHAGEVRRVRLWRDLPIYRYLDFFFFFLITFTHYGMIIFHSYSSNAESDSETPVIFIWIVQPVSSSNYLTQIYKFSESRTCFVSD